MPLSTIERTTGENPRASVILMHGLGADGNDFVSMVREMDLAAVGPVRFVFPNAPRIPVSVNNGYVMPAWYDIVSIERTIEDEAGMRRSQAAIEELLAIEKARGIPAGRIVLAGFSQGCAMALLTGVRHREKLAGIMALSGYLPLVRKTTSERSLANDRTPIFMGHGAHDPVIGQAFAIASRDVLIAMGHPVEWHSYPMEHSVCMEEIEDMSRWLQKVLA